MTMPFSRREMMRVALGSLLLPVCRTAQGQGLSPVAEEPTYTVTLADKKKLALQAAVRNAASGGGAKQVRIFNRPKSAAPSDALLDMVLTTDSSGGRVEKCRAFFNVKPAVRVNLEAVRDEKGAYAVGVPSESGTLPFGAPLVTQLTALLFLGKLYSFTRGGPQNFAFLVDFGAQAVEIVTLTLTADGQETLTLPGGAVKARKLRYKAPVASLPKEHQEGVFYIGPRGEVLKCETNFFILPIQAEKPAAFDRDSRTLTLTFATPLVPNLSAVLRAVSRGTRGYGLTLQIDRGQTLATVECDPAYRPVKIETPWMSRPFTARVVGTTVQYTLAATKEGVHAVPSGNAWFLPYWFVTEFWEEGSGGFAGMGVGDRRDGDFFPLFTGQRDSNPFALERLPDTEARTPNGQGFSLRRYRFANKPTTGLAAFFQNNVYELYTDGRRLVALLGSDGITIFRDGWTTAFTATLKPPAAQKPAPPL